MPQSYTRAWHADAVQLHVAAVGDGPTRIALVHGLVDARRTWATIRELL